jgi:NitT/TauT family transport system substrate-binding protein
MLSRTLARPPLARALVALALLLGLATAGCGSSEDLTSNDNAQAASGGQKTQTIVLGAVPTLELGALTLGQQQGFFDQQGIRLEIKNVDSGPNVVTGVVAGQYDVGSTAYAPPLLAAGQGVPLKLVSNAGTVGPEGTNGGVLVEAKGGITRWRDLAGKKIATNAPRSLLSLVIPAAVKKDGGDPSGIRIVPLPFNAIGKAVASGQVAAGAVLEPFQGAALKQYPSLRNLGDATYEVLPQGSPGGVYFTSAKTQGAKADALARFKRALQASLEYANEHVDETKAAGAPLAGLRPEDARKLPLGEFSPRMPATGLDPLVNLMIEFDWLKDRSGVQEFVG